MRPAGDFFFIQLSNTRLDKRLSKIRKNADELARMLDSMPPKK